MGKSKASKDVETLLHTEDKRSNIPTAEHQSVLQKEHEKPRTVKYPRNTDLDPQLVWRGKDEQDWSDLVVQAPPIYIQEKVHPKALIDELIRHSKDASRAEDPQIDLFSDFNGIPEGADKTEFYQHEQNWTNRMILGDSLQVMASLAEREGLRGKVQCIYMDPPYGIKFNSNFQWSTTSRDVKDGKAEHITREPEQVKAFRDTWRDGIHSYLTYLRDRLTVARDLLTDSGSIFVQIGDENVHRVRAVMDEVFGEENFCSQITFRKTTGKGSGLLDVTSDSLLWYCKQRSEIKFRDSYEPRNWRSEVNVRFVQMPNASRRSLTTEELDGLKDPPVGSRLFRSNPLTSARSPNQNDVQRYVFEGTVYSPGARTFSTNITGLGRLSLANRLIAIGRSLSFIRFVDDFGFKPSSNIWEDTRTGGFGDEKMYVVQTVRRVLERCYLMTTDPGDLVVDPTCGSGTTAYVAEQWGRRWITIDTSRVALALARARIMGARYPYYLLADSLDGAQKEAELSERAFVPKATFRNIRHGFVNERVPHTTLKSIANNAEIDVIWEIWRPKVTEAIERLNLALRGHGKPYRVTAGGREAKDVTFDADDGALFTMPSGEKVPANALVEWEVPREAPADWPDTTKGPLADFWDARISRQREIDASIAAKADDEFLFDKPYQDSRKVRVAGPFTVESLSPHRIIGIDENGDAIDPVHVAESSAEVKVLPGFEQMILENLKVAGLQQAHKEGRILFSSLHGWPGTFLCAEGRYDDGGAEKRAGIFIGPEFGTISRPDLVEAAREAGDAGFDVLVACGFNYEAHATEFNKLGRIPVLKARMNADLHMASELKNTGQGNLFVVFGEPDIEIIPEGNEQLRVKVNGVDVFDPASGEVRSDGADGIAAWFIDTDYNGESFFVRHAYFLGQNDPYKSLKTTLKAEVDEDAWSTLHSDVSRPFARPKSGRVAVKVINHLGDEVMKVFRI